MVFTVAYATVIYWFNVVECVISLWAGTGSICMLWIVLPGHHDDYLSMRI